MYCIAEFTGPNPCVAVVHKSWFCGKKCYWPPSANDSVKLASMLKKAVTPNSCTWKLFEARVVGEKYFDTYEMAITNLNKSMDASDFSSNEEAGRLRKRKLAHGSDSESEVEEGKHFTATPKRKVEKTRRKILPPFSLPPMSSTTPANLVPENISSVVRENRAGDVGHVNNEVTYSLGLVDVVSGASQRNSNYQDHTTSGNTSCVQESSVELPVFPPAWNEYRTYQSSATGFETNNIPSSNITSTGQPTYGQPYLTQSWQPVDNVIDLVRAIQTQQEIMCAKVDIALDLLRTLLQGKNQQQQTVEQISLPLQDMDRFNKLHEKAKQDKDVREGIVTMLSTKGGNTTNQMTHRAIAALLTDELMSLFTFAGRTGKTCFKDTIFMSCICEAVRRQPRGAVANDKEIEKAAEYWLKKASNRLSKRVNERVHNTDQDDVDEQEQDGVSEIINTT